MRAALSVIIPTLEAEAVLPQALAALIEGLHAGLIREVIVSDGGSVDATLRVAGGAGAVIVRGQPSRGGQLRRGALVATGPWLLFLHADTVLPEGWPELVRAQMADGRPAHFRLRFGARGVMPVVVAGWANLRSRLFGLPYGDQGLLIAQAEYEAAGGHPDIPLMEDVALARALRGRLRVMPAPVRTSAAQFQRTGWLRRGARNMFLLLQYFCGTDPAVLAARYRR